MEIYPIPALRDNYIWGLVHGSSVLVVDPGSAKPVEQILKDKNLTLAGIMITHHHFDHTNGIEELIANRKIPVYGPANDLVRFLTNPVKEGDTFSIGDFPMKFSVLDIPGHTNGHIAYLSQDMLFCGDTLFAGGCGRVFEGTPKEMYESLLKLKALPDITKVYCAHEYTLNNLKFARVVEPDNADLKERIVKVGGQRELGSVTLPSLLGEEKATNPFLRCDKKSVKEAVEKHCKKTLASEIEVFAGLRKWKNEF